jgi:hypothetical protein
MFHGRGTCAGVVDCRILGNVTHCVDALPSMVPAPGFVTGLGPRSTPPLLRRATTAQANLHAFLPSLAWGRPI